MSARAVGYRHEAFPYAGHDEFVSSSAAFLREGIESGERAILVALGGKVDDVREAMGADAAEVRFHDMGVAGRNPARIISVFQRFIAEDDSGRRIRGLGEPVYPSRSPAALAEAQLHELLLNSDVLDQWDFWLGCPYDVTVLDDRALQAMRDSHPIIAGATVPDSRGADLAAAVFATALPAVPVGAVRHRFEADELGSDDLSGAREFARAHAAGAGLHGKRGDDLVCAVNEAVTNSIRYGSGSAVVSIWLDGHSLLCDVHDSGVIVDPTAGRFEPPPHSIGGRGLWLINRLCDLVQVRSSSAGTSVRMFMDL